MPLDASVLDLIFEEDGSYRDIYITDVQVKDWEKLIEHLKSSDAKLRFLRNSEETNLQSYGVKQIFEERKDFSFLLSIDFNGVTINTHFFDEQEIEFDINPADIKTPKNRNTVFQFMILLAKSLHKNVSITPENCPQSPYAVVHTNGRITVGI